MPSKLVELNEAQQRVLAELNAQIRSAPIGPRGRPNLRVANSLQRVAAARLKTLGLSSYTAKGIIQGTTPWVARQKGS